MASTTARTHRRRSSFLAASASYSSREGSDGCERGTSFTAHPAEHILVGAGEAPCVVVMAGTRRPGRPIHYPVSDLALRHRAGVEVATDAPPDAYSGYPEERIERPPFWDSLPWA
jgi:hypothetical protein